MLQVLEHQKKLISVAVLGKHHLPKDATALTFSKALKLCNSPLPDDKSRIFHARRNREALHALVLKKLSRTQIKIAFTSTAQRHHSWITRWILRKADAVLTTSSAANAYIKGGADLICPHGVDLKRYYPSENRSALWKKLGFPGKYGIGIFGRVRHQKGIDVLIDASIPLLSKYPDFTVVICGETTPAYAKYLQELKSKISAAGLENRFVFLGERPFSELPELFRAMHLVAALSRNEGFGLTVLEAMASGTAVLASETGAWKDIVRPGTTGFIVPCGNVEATQESLETLLNDIGFLESLGKNGRHLAETQHTLEHEAKTITEFFRSLQTPDSVNGDQSPRKQRT